VRLPAGTRVVWRVRQLKKAALQHVANSPVLVNYVVFNSQTLPRPQWVSKQYRRDPSANPCEANMNTETKPFDAVRQLLAAPARQRAETPERSFEKLRSAARRLGWSVPQLYRMSNDGLITIYANGSRGRAVLRGDVDGLIDAMVAAGPAKPHGSINKALAARLARRGNAAATS
jgi:hypothetical protein